MSSPSKEPIASILGKDLPLKELHTKLANPRDVVAELKEMVGEGLFKVEIRHDVYNIRSAKEFDIETLLKNCQRRQRGDTPSNTTIKDNMNQPDHVEHVISEEASVGVED
ncbi:hypothetical protein F4809DRAFT_596998 [Biscogniauxia mediterranea]|nr:hypothetical protein F4809DRAFT_596998 [Biscogniauxia mediterranea]